MAKKASSKRLHTTVTKPSAPARDKAALPSGNSKNKKTDAAHVRDSVVGGDALNRKVRKQRVSPKTRALIGALLDDPDLTLTKAGKKAGWPNNPAQNAHQALKSPSARELFRREMAKRPGLKHSALAEKLEQGLNAMTTKLFAHEGSIVDERELVDYGARHAYLALATRLADLDPASRTELTGAGGAPLNTQAQIVVLPALTTEQLLALLDIKEPADAPLPPPATPPAAEAPKGTDGGK